MSCPGPSNFKYFLFIYLFIKTYLYRVVHNQTILILFYSVALFLAKVTAEIIKIQTLFTSSHVLVELS